MRRRNAPVLAGVDTAQRPTRTDMTVAAEQQVLVKVKLVERGKELHQVLPDVRHRERHAQPAYPSQAVQGEPAQVRLDVTTVQRGDRLTNEARFDVAAHRAITQRAHSVDICPLWWPHLQKSRPAFARVGSCPIRWAKTRAGGAARPDVPRARPTSLTPRSGCSARTVCATARYGELPSCPGTRPPPFTSSLTASNTW